MRLALELARRCPPSTSAYSVGAVVVDTSGGEMSRGYSRATDERVHAEEAALAKLGPGEAAGATLYSTLEPCSQRASRPRSCTALILAAGITRVVIAWREPALFVADCQGVELLRAGGVRVVELPEFADPARTINAHLPLGR